jgi:hypothetical protein
MEKSTAKVPRATVPLDNKDREALAAIREHYGLSTDAAAIHLSLRETHRAIKRQTVAPPK